LFIKNTRLLIRKLLFPNGSGSASAQVKIEHQAGLSQAGNERSLRVQRVGVIPVHFIQALPYVLTVLLLAGFVGKAQPPKAIGEPYIKER